MDHGSGNAMLQQLQGIFGNYTSFTPKSDRIFNETTIFLRETSRNCRKAMLPGSLDGVFHDYREVLLQLAHFSRSRMNELNRKHTNTTTMKTKSTKSALSANSTSSNRLSEKRRGLLESYFSNALILAALLESAQKGIGR